MHYLGFIIPLVVAGGILLYCADRRRSRRPGAPPRDVDDVDRGRRHSPRGRHEYGGADETED